MESQSASAAIMCSADDEEDLYSLESMGPGGIIAATEREAVFVWHSFLSLVRQARVTITDPAHLSKESSNLGRGATFDVFERQWLDPHQTDSSKTPRVVAVKQLIFSIPDTADDTNSRPAREPALLAHFTLELRALCHGTLRTHPNIVSITHIYVAVL
jgi:hypothetical protein